MEEKQSQPDSPARVLPNRVCVIAIIKKGNSILFGKKSPGKGPYPDTWHLIGGGVDLLKETTDEAVKREILEEAGLKVKNLVKTTWDTDVEPNKHGVPTYYLFLTYECEYESGDLKPNDDLQHIEWVQIDELKNLNLNRPTRKYFEQVKLI